MCGRPLNPVDTEVVFPDIPQCVSDICSPLPYCNKLHLCPKQPTLASYIDLMEREGGRYRGENKEVVN